MIRFSRPRTTKDLYSTELIHEIANDLGITDPEKIVDLKEILERAALNYIRNKKRQGGQYTEAKENKELLRFSKSIEKSKEILKKLFLSANGAEFRLLHSIQSLQISNPKERSALLDLIQCGNGIVDFEALIRLLDAIQTSANLASKENHIFSKKNDTEIVLQWLWEFSDFWEAFSLVKISEGREFNSPAIRILNKITSPINKIVSIQNRILASLIGEAIKLHRKSRNSAGNSNVFLDNPEDMIQ